MGAAKLTNCQANKLDADVGGGEAGADVAARMCECECGYESELAANALDKQNECTPTHIYTENRNPETHSLTQKSIN